MKWRHREVNFSFLPNLTNPNYSAEIIVYSQTLSLHKNSLFFIFVFISFSNAPSYHTRTHTHTYIKEIKHVVKKEKKKVEVWKAIGIKVSEKSKWESRQRDLEYFK